MSVDGYWNTDGASPFDLDEDTRYTVRISGVDGWLVKLSIYLDGFGAGNDPQSLRGVVYLAGEDATPAESLLGYVEGSVAIDAPADWVDFEFDPPLQVRATQEYHVGLQAGPATDSLRAYAPAGSRREATDSYADGPDALYGAYTDAGSGLLVFATFLPDFVVPQVSDEEIARLPRARAEALFGASVPPRMELRRAHITWHGTTVDQERGSVAIARTDGPLADWVGERLRVAIGENAVSVYCHAETLLDDDEDLSLPRPIFARLGKLSSDPVLGVVGVLL